MGRRNLQEGVPAMSYVANLTISSKLVVAVAVIVAVTLISDLITNQKLAFIEKSNGWTTHTYEVLEQTQDVMAALVDQETGVRGYLLSGDDRFLEPYRAGREAYVAALANSRTLTLDNPAQQKREGGFVL